MAEIRLIKKEDIPNLNYSFIDWDVELDGIPYQVIRVPGFAHCLGGHLDFGCQGNCFWAYPLGEQLTMHNLIEFNGEPGATWGIEYITKHSRTSKWGELSMERYKKVTITRNGKPFFDELLTLNKAIYLLTEGPIYEHPLELNTRDYDKKCIGRKVWYRSEPGIINYCRGGSVNIIPDGVEEFSYPKEYGEPSDEPRTQIRTSIFDSHIWWFRD